MRAGGRRVGGGPGGPRWLQEGCRRFARLRAVVEVRVRERAHPWEALVGCVGRGRLGSFRLIGRREGGEVGVGGPDFGGARRLDHRGNRDLARALGGNAAETGGVVCPGTCLGGWADDQRRLSAGRGRLAARGLHATGRGHRADHPELPRRRRHLFDVVRLVRVGRCFAGATRGTDGHSPRRTGRGGDATLGARDTGRRSGGTTSRTGGEPGRGGEPASGPGRGA